MKLASRPLVRIAIACLLVTPLPAAALCTLACSCSASTAAVAFGSYNPLASANMDVTGSITVTCSGVLGLTVPFTIAMNRGINASSFSPRKLASGSNLLNYNLYDSAARTSIWGDGTGGTNTVSGSVNTGLAGSASATFTVYGRIPGSQNTTPPGSYSDTVTVTVTYS